MIPKLAILVSVVVVLATAVSAAASSERTAGTLRLQTVFSTKWNQVDCPAGTASPPARCFVVEGQAVVPGLGTTTERNTYVVDNFAGSSTSVHVSAAIVVAGKGEIDASAATQADVCPCSASPVPFDFTITGGTGVFDGAQGSGALVDTQRATTPTAGVGQDAWTGTLTVPGYTFDTAPPVIKTVAPKRVDAPKGAKRVRVRYAVTAHDPDEGLVPVTCAPRSGSRFKVGRTTVHCRAVDANGNTARASFKVRVVRRA